MFVVLIAASVPISIFPVPALSVREEAPVADPTETTFAAAPVPILLLLNQCLMLQVHLID